MARLGLPYLTEGMWNAVLIIAIVSSACVGGVLFAFSAFVMPALGHTPPAEAIRAMQSINVFAQRAPFGIVILVSAAASIALAARQISDWQGLGSVLVLVGAGVYLVVGFGLSGAVNIPLNNGLAIAVPTAADAASIWQAYTHPWEVANHLRAASGLVAAAAFSASAILRSA